MKNRYFLYGHNLFSYMRENVTKEDQKKAVLPLILFSESTYRSYPYTEYAMLFEKEAQKLRIYEIGKMMNENFSIYNLLVLKYKTLGFFARKEKEEIISNMKDLCSGYKSFYPANKWLEKNKIKHNIDKKYYSINVYSNKGLIDFE